MPSVPIDFVCGGTVGGLKMRFDDVFERVLIFVLIYSVGYNAVCAEGRLGDPYQILEIGRRASQQEIRQAFKKLVKKW